MPYIKSNISSNIFIGNRINKKINQIIYMERQDYVYLYHTIKNANSEIKKIRRKFNKEKDKILKLKRNNKTRKKRN